MTTNLQNSEVFQVDENGVTAEPVQNVNNATTQPEQRHPTPSKTKTKETTIRKSQRLMLKRNKKRQAESMLSKVDKKYSSRLGKLSGKQPTEVVNKQQCLKVLNQIQKGCARVENLLDRAKIEQKNLNQSLLQLSQLMQG
eukprot:TRINITY_DN8863_c0_g1_i1.p2 TRINITY_DN8863_c0_g1~~TRINITY_DN8863_c0_g1_i1.p2  ORF type:complete len:140 (+),score=18.07 TRINITY_DN8863_c0_g1_i1:61-480(+)